MRENQEKSAKRNERKASDALVDKIKAKIFAHLYNMCVCIYVPYMSICHTVCVAATLSLAPCSCLCFIRSDFLCLQTFGSVARKILLPLRFCHLLAHKSIRTLVSARGFLAPIVDLSRCQSAADL